MVAEIDVKPRLSLKNSASESKTPVEHPKEESTSYVVKDRLLFQPETSERQYLSCPQNGLITQQNVVEQVVQLTGKTENLDNILGNAVKMVEEAFDAKCCVVWQTNADLNSKVCYVSHSTRTENLIKLCTELSNYYSYTLSEGIFLSLSQREETLLPTVKAAMAEAQVNSLILVPLYKNTYWGEICLYSSQQERQWTEAELEKVRNIATQCAIAIEQAQLTKQIQQQQVMANLLKEISRTINLALELEQILSVVLERVGRSFSADRVVLFCQNEKELQIWGEWQVSNQSLDSMTPISESAQRNDAQLNNSAKHTAQLNLRNAGHPQAAEELLPGGDSSHEKVRGSSGQRAEAGDLNGGNQFRRRALVNSALPGETHSEQVPRRTTHGAEVNSAPASSGKPPAQNSESAPPPHPSKAPCPIS